jgi:hypothetical protein
MDQISKEDQVKMAIWYVDVTEKELCKLKIQLYLVKNLLVLNNEKYRNVLIQNLINGK